MILKNVLNKCLNAAGFLILFYTFFFLDSFQTGYFQTEIIIPFL